MTCILVDGVGRCKVIEHPTSRRIIVYDGRSYELSEQEKLNELPVYRLVGYLPPPIRWGR